jgi:multidrug transporter EmrE-like cation transporter
MAYILLASIVEYFGDSSLKLYARTGIPGYLALGGSFYVIIVGLLTYLLKYSNVAYMNLAWDGSSALIETAFAMIFLGERLSNSFQYFGAVFIILGMFLLNYGPVPV